MIDHMLRLLDDLDAFKLNVNSYFDDKGYSELVDNMLEGKMKALAMSLDRAKFKAESVELRSVTWNRGEVILVLEILRGSIIPNIRATLQGQRAGEADDRGSRISPVPPMEAPRGRSPGTPEASSPAPSPHHTSIPALHAAAKAPLDLNEGRDLRAVSKRVFISHAPEDESLRAQFEKHLSPLERSGKATIWHAGKLLPGDVGSHTIDTQLRAADVILLLVTPDFLASDSLHDNQVRPSLARSEIEDVRVVPILAKPCAWRASALTEFEPLPKNRTPIALWPHPDEAWADVVAGLEEVFAQSTKQLHVSFSKQSEPQRFQVDEIGPASFFRLHVLNRGQTIARGCVGQLVSVRAIDSPLTDLLGKPMGLQWAHELDFAPIAISPGEMRLLDLFYVLDGNTYLDFCIERPAWPVGIRSTLPIRNYMVEVRLTAQDVVPSTEVFRIECAGDWRNIQVRRYHPDAASKQR